MRKKKRRTKRRYKNINPHLLIKVTIFLVLVALLQIIDRYTFDGAVPPNKIYLEVFLFFALFLFVAYRYLKEAKHKADGVYNKESRVILDVNGHEHDVTSGYSSLQPGEAKYLEITLPLVYHFGVNPIKHVIKNGKIVVRDGKLA